ncbi:ATP-binding protein [Salinarimonas sp.]|uniref:sensor histidine kinase n=1 Tax=Salinarimonas sp. TaxID=2766526 RepID=UPI00391994B6
MRISSKVALVGGIPIVIAAAIAVASWLLLVEAERARAGAALAGASYRDLASLARSREDYASALPQERERHAFRFQVLADSAQAQLSALAAAPGSVPHRENAGNVAATLAVYRSEMDELLAVTRRNDALIAEMADRAGILVALADAARERQNTSNSDILATLAAADRALRLSRDIVDAAQEARAAFLSVERLRAGTAGTGTSPVEERRLRFARARMRHAVEELSAHLERGDRAETGIALRRVLSAYDGAFARGARAAAGGGESEDAPSEVAAWLDDLIKVNATEQRALHNQTAELLAYSVRAGETEQATQNVAIATLKLGQRTADALAARDVDAVGEILAESRALAETMAALPISPLIQSEMIDAIDGWSTRLDTTREGVAAQNALMESMGRTAQAMLLGAQSLASVLDAEAVRIGETVRRMLVLGAAFGLLIGIAAALVVARSITRPIDRLREDMLTLARDPQAGTIAPPKGGFRRGRDGQFRDELTAMAHAVNTFVTEIGQRESALRRAKDEVDSTLLELRRTQADLIQAEKLASLGQIVAGVAHEINTPLGVALTTATALEGEVERLGASVTEGRILRSELTRSLARLDEGARLVHVNLARAADMVQSFKRVAADQTSEERRRFEMGEWLRELLTSLGPALRKSGHEVETRCPPDLVLDTYPGALAQVVTNLVMNSVDHAFAPGESGRITIAIERRGPRHLRLVFDDDGRGIARDSAAKVFEPFFTTARERGNTGLGLHIVFNLVTGRLGGKIELDQSGARRGARFVLDLPLSAADEPQSVAAQ